MPTHMSDSQRFADQYTEIARLAGGLAHEIKNPLSTIRLNMQLLAEELEGLQSPVQQRALKRVEIMKSECQRLQDLLDDFLNYARVREIHREPSDLNQEISDALDFFEPEANEADIEILRYLDPDLPRVLLDRESFRGALWNLLLNAKQAMPDGGQLIVQTASSGPNVAVNVIDTGHGMDERTAVKMFEAFFSTKPSGSGLGLPTTSNIIEAHGGQIRVQSEEGRGTKFIVELPALQQLPDEP